MARSDNKILATAGDFYLLLPSSNFVLLIYSGYILCFSKNEVLINIYFAVYMSNNNAAALQHEQYVVQPGAWYHLWPGQTREGGCPCPSLETFLFFQNLSLVFLSSCKPIFRYYGSSSNNSIKGAYCCCKHVARVIVIVMPLKPDVLARNRPLNACMQVA